VPAMQAQSRSLLARLSLSFSLVARRAAALAIRAPHEEAPLDQNEFRMHGMAKPY